jgi:hypothetical protein
MGQLNRILLLIGSSTGPMKGWVALNLSLECLIVCKFTIELSGKKLPLGLSLIYTGDAMICFGCIKLSIKFYANQQ